MYVPLQVNILQKSILLIVQYKYIKSFSGDFILQNLIHTTRSCGTAFLTQSSWGFHFHQTTPVWQKCFVPQLYQFRMFCTALVPVSVEMFCTAVVSVVGISGVQPLNIFT